MEQLELTGKGAEFFGLSHPVVQNLIQSCPGSRRCTGYRWVKFEINKMADSLEMDSLDPSTSYNALKIFLNNGKSYFLFHCQKLNSLNSTKDTFCMSP